MLGTEVVSDLILHGTERARRFFYDVANPGLHLQPFYVKNFNTKSQDYPIASSYSERILSIPLYPKMSEANVERVIETVRSLVTKFRR